MHPFSHKMAAVESTITNQVTVVEENRQMRETPSSGKSEKSVLMHLLPNVNLPSYTSHSWFFAGMAVALTSSAVLSVMTSWDDLNNGKPETGELGHGHFDIMGVTYPFEYPFRLAQSALTKKLVPWLCFFVHQGLQWRILYKARQAKMNKEIEWTGPAAGDLTSPWNPFAYQMLQLNLVMILVHYLESRFVYEGLCASFPEISTLFAGVSALVVGFMFETRRRGLVFGWSPSSTTGFIGWFKDFAYFVKQYHGYLASFGIVLTFWYHPFESTWAHWTGWLHMFLLLFQSSLIYQRAHKNRYWTALLEFWILVHGTTVAYFQGYLGGALYVMFLTSFTLLFLMSTVWGLPVLRSYLDAPTDASEKRKRWLSVLVPMLIIYAGFACYMYAQANALDKIFLVIALPGLYYIFMAYYFLWFLYGKFMDTVLTNWGVQRKGTVWMLVMTAIGAASICVIMNFSEFIYRLFVPYH